jgi:hypothetical protein
MISNRRFLPNISAHAAPVATASISNRQFPEKLARLETGLISRVISKFQNSNRQFQRPPSPVVTRYNWGVPSSLRAGRGSMDEILHCAQNDGDAQVEWDRLSACLHPALSRVCLRRRRDARHQTRAAPTALVHPYPFVGICLSSSSALTFCGCNELCWYSGRTETTERRSF